MLVKTWSRSLIGHHQSFSSLIDAEQHGERFRKRTAPLGLFCAAAADCSNNDRYLLLNHILAEYCGR